MSIIGTVITVSVALAGVMYALVNGTHRRIDDVRSENRETHAGVIAKAMHDGLEGVSRSTSRL